MYILRLALLLFVLLIKKIDTNNINAEVEYS